MTVMEKPGTWSCPGGTVFPVKKKGQKKKKEKEIHTLMAAGVTTRHPRLGHGDLRMGVSKKVWCVKRRRKHDRYHSSGPK
jgi:hypothetical protein